MAQAEVQPELRSAVASPPGSVPHCCWPLPQSTEFKPLARLGSLSSGNRGNSTSQSLHGAAAHGLGKLTRRASLRPCMKTSCPQRASEECQAWAVYCTGSSRGHRAWNATFELLAEPWAMTRPGYCVTYGDMCLGGWPRPFTPSATCFCPCSPQRGRCNSKSPLVSFWK